MEGIDRLHQIAEDVGRTVWLRDLGAALSDTADAIEGGTRDLGGYESDVLTWVREHGGLDIVKKLLDWVVGHCSTKQQLDFDFWLSGRVMYELGFDEDMADRDEVERRLLARLMPDGCEWPRYEDGEPVRIGDVVSDVEVRSVVFRDSGILLSDCTSVPGWGTWRSYKEPIKRPALDADGALTREGDEVWSTTGEFDGKRTVSSVHIDPDEPPYAMFEERQKPYSCLCCYLTHRAPVLAADGEPLKVGQMVWHTKTGAEYRVLSLPDGEKGAWLGNSNGKYFLDYAVLTHQRPVLDADGAPIKKGDEVYLTDEACVLSEVPSVKGEPLVVTYFKYNRERSVCAIDQFDIENGITVPWCLKPGWVTHTKPEPDSWSSVWADVSNGNETPEGMMRRCRALVRRGE